MPRTQGDDDWSPTCIDWGQEKSQHAKYGKYDRKKIKQRKQEQSRLGGTCVREKELERDGGGERQKDRKERREREKKRGKRIERQTRTVNIQTFSHRDPSRNYSLSC